MKKTLSAIADKRKKYDGNTGNNSSVSNTASVEELMTRYSSKTESELMDELLKAVAQQKAEGSFDPSALQNGINAIMPMLNEEQKQRLTDVTSKL